LNQHFTKVLAVWFTSSLEVTSDIAKDWAGCMKVADRLFFEIWVSGLGTGKNAKFASANGHLLV
jgi:hypothetical protein